MIEIEYGDIEIVNDLIQETVDTNIEIDYDIDLDYILETAGSKSETPLYDAYLKKHEYEEESNTLLYEGKRVNAGNMDPKVKKNIETFFRNHKYNPKNETIQLDVTDDKGHKVRVKFKINEGVEGLNGIAYSTHSRLLSYKATEIEINRNDFEHLANVETTLGHESAHVEIGYKVKAYLKDARKVWKSLDKLNTLFEIKAQLLRDRTTDKMTHDQALEIVLTDPGNKLLVKKFNNLSDKLNAQLSNISKMTGQKYDIKPLITPVKSWYSTREYNDLKKRDEKMLNNIKILVTDVKALFPEYQEAKKFMDKKIFKFVMNDHDKDPEEFYADKRGDELARKYHDDSDFGSMMYVWNYNIDTNFPTDIDELTNDFTEKTLERVKRNMCIKKCLELLNKCNKEKPSGIKDDIIKLLFNLKLEIRLKQEKLSTFHPGKKRLSTAECEKELKKYTGFFSDKQIKSFIKIIDKYIDEYIDYCKNDIKPKLDKVKNSPIRKVGRRIKAGAYASINTPLHIIQPNEMYGYKYRDEYVKKGRKEALDRSMKAAPTDNTTKH